MLRAISGAIVGYVALVIVVIAGLALAWAVLGGTGSFSGDGPYPSTAWNASALISGFVAAFLGGWVALKIGRSVLAVKILVALMLVLGLYGALTAESAYQKYENKSSCKKYSIKWSRSRFTAPGKKLMETGTLNLFVT